MTIEYISLLITLTISTFAVVIVSITGSYQIWKTSVLKTWKPFWGAKELTSGRKWSSELNEGKYIRKEKFPLSSTVLSFLTDAWHLAITVIIIGFSVSGYLTAIIYEAGKDFNALWNLLNVWILTYGIIFNYLYHYKLVSANYKSRKALPKWQELTGIGVVITLVLASASLLQHGYITTGWTFLYIIAPVFAIIAINAVVNVGGWILNLFKR